MKPNEIQPDDLKTLRVLADVARKSLSNGDRANADLAVNTAEQYILGDPDRGRLGETAKQFSNRIARLRRFATLAEKAQQSSART
jgi:hypothetical protein